MAGDNVPAHPYLEKTILATDILRPVARIVQVKNVRIRRFGNYIFRKRSFKARKVLFGHSR